MPVKQINVIIENPAGSSRVKYETDKKDGRIIVDRFRRAGMAYPGNYGFIPGTLSPDGDPVDVLVVEPTPVYPGAGMAVVPIGVLYMVDEHGADEKIIAVPAPALQSDYSAYTEYAALPAATRHAIEHFFKHYKDAEPGKWSRLDGVGDAAAAAKVIAEGYQRARKPKGPQPKIP